MNCDFIPPIFFQELGRIHLMIECLFQLNSKKISNLICAAQSFPAFSGKGNSVNHSAAACLPNEGPIPPGVYYIFDRQSGGLLGSFRDIFTGRDEWFALYAADERIDDEMLCNKIRRGQSRLHPKGALGRSEGCIVIEKETDFQILRATLKTAKQIQIPGLDLKAYGRLTVR